jgi:lipooligosaccharide transport system permease protein
MFLFSGTFFPIEQLPELIRPLAWLTPLFHGVALTRALALGRDLDPVVIGIHVAVLLALIAVGTALALRTFQRRLIV